MRITILQGAFLPVPPLLGGAVEKMWFRLGQQFALLGHEVTHVSRRYGTLPTHESIGGVNHIRLRGYDQPRSLIQLKMLDFLYSVRASLAAPRDSEVVITNTFWAPALLSNNLKRRAYVDIQRMPKGQCRLYGKAGRLRANSRPVAEAIRRELPEAQHGRVSMIPNPLPFDPPRDLDFGAKAPQILYCGRIHPEKGLDLLIPAVQGLPPGWTVELVGPWETSQGGAGKAYLDQLKALAQGFPITFHGPEFNMERLSQHYRRASIFVYPSVAEQGETFGLAPLEAMAWGCVPVVSDLACFKDFIRPGENGLIFEHRPPDPVGALGRALSELMQNPQTRERLAVEAVKVNASHAPGRVAEMFLEDFVGMLDGESGKRKAESGKRKAESGKRNRAERDSLP
jgi:glycosyltransferase involved in cell wall biosynthesis